MRKRRGDRDTIMINNDVERIKIKKGKKFYTNITAIRAFIDLHSVIQLLEKIENKIVFNKKFPDLTEAEILSIAKRTLNSSSLTFGLGLCYRSFDEANKYCDKLCDGMTEDTFSIIVTSLNKYPSGHSTYECLISDESIIKAKREKIMVSLDPIVFNYLFRVVLQ